MYSDEIRAKEEENQATEVNIHPLSKWRRILVFLGDFFISFMVCFVLFNVVTVPIAGVIIDSSSVTEKMILADHTMDDVLYENNILFFKNSVSNKYAYSSNLKYTFKRYLSYYVLDEKLNEFGPQIENEIFIHYYKDIRNDEITYYNMVETQNQGYHYFIIESKSISLKDEVRSELKNYFYYPDEPLGESADKMVDRLTNIFLLFNKEVMNDIKVKDLTSNGKSYNKAQKELQDLTNLDNMAISLALIIAYIMTWAILHVLVPLLNGTGKTLTMMIMKTERVGMNNLSSLKRGDTFITNIYYLFFEMAFVFFLPLTYSSTGFIYCINLPFIPFMFLFSLIMIIGSSFVIIFNQFNRSLGDLLSRSVMIPREDLDEIYRHKGYVK